MENFFSWFNGVTTTYSDMQIDEDGVAMLYVLLSRFDGKHFDFILMTVPELLVIETKGFSDEEIKYWHDYTAKDVKLIWREAKKKLVKELA